MLDFTVKQLADLAKISVRTLHYYDEIGLLKPSFKAANNYRFYNENDTRILQQILIYRELGFPLKKIKAIISAKDFDLKVELSKQLTTLEDGIERHKMLVAIIKKTIENIESDKKMKSELYEWPSEALQIEHKEYLIERYGEWLREPIEHSQKAFSKLDKVEKEKILNRLENIEKALVDAFQSGIGAESIGIIPLLDAHRDWVSYMWARECPKYAYAQLADTYTQTPDFVTRYETLAEGFSIWLPNAMKTYAARD